MFSVLTLLAFRILCGIGEGQSIQFQTRGPLFDVKSDNDVFFEIVYPPELQYTFKLSPAKDFGVPFNSSFLEERIPLVPTDPPHSCQNAKNAKELRGRVALVERGECSFFIKSIMAEEAGAKAIIIADYPATTEESITSPLWADHYYIKMVRDNTVPLAKTVNIPAGFLLGKNGKMIRQILQQLDEPFALINIPVNLTYMPLEKLHQPPWLFW